MGGSVVGRKRSDSFGFMNFKRHGFFGGYDLVVVIQYDDFFPHFFGKINITKWNSLSPAVLAMQPNRL